MVNPPFCNVMRSAVCSVYSNNTVNYQTCQPLGSTFMPNDGKKKVSELTFLGGPHLGDVGCGIWRLEDGRTGHKVGGAGFRQAGNVLQTHSPVHLDLNGPAADQFPTVANF